MRKVLIASTVCLLAMLLAAPAFAQRTAASIRGTVTDSTGGVLPGATVTVTNEDTGLARTTVTNGEGVYAVSQLPVGRYKVDAELSGFKTASRTGILLRVADDYAVDVELQTGAISEVVTVEASATPVRVLGGDVSGVVTGEQVRELPLNGRNFLQLATLMPGVSAPDFLNVKDKGLLGGSDLSVSGSDVTANMWTVDGANNNDVGSNRTILVYPSIDAIEEFKILRNSYGPEFGGAGGAQINIVTRGGANEFHGSGFYSGRNDAFNATNYFLEQANQPKEELKRNDFGGAFGGPIRRDKLFFFGSLEWNIEDRGTARTAFVPTDAERAGDFSGARIPGCSPDVPIDPLTGEPFPGNRIPADRLSPGGEALLRLYPSPNVTPTGGSCNNWVTSVTSPIRYNQQNIRGDWNVSNATRVMVRYTHDSWKNEAPSIFTNLWGDDPFPSVDSNWDQPSQSFVASLNQTFGQTATNTLQFSYAGNKIIVDRGGLNPQLNSEILSAVPSVFPLDSKQYGSETGHPLFWGGSGYEALWNEAPFRNNQDLYILKDDYTQVFGKHFVKAGLLASINRKNEDTNGNGSTMNSQFWGATGLVGGGDVTTGNVIGDFLLRDMLWGFNESSVSRSAPQRWHDLELYAADSWHVLPRVTLDYGVRYSMFFNPYTSDDKIMSFVPDRFDPALGADPCNGLLEPPDENWCAEAGALGGAKGPNRSLMTQDLNNIAPRLGVAWDVFGDGRTALRGGVGQFFLRERLSPVLNIATNPPFVTTLAGTRLLDSAAEPCDGCFGNSLGVPAAGREVDMHTPNTWQWNVMLQREVWRNTTVEVGYVGAHGYDLLRNSNVNQVFHGDINGNGVDDRLEYVTTTPANGALRRYGVFGDSQIGFWRHDGESTYHSMQVQFISRFRQASQLQASYTLSRSRANLALTDSGGLAQNTAALDLADPDLDWGRPETGRTHIFNASLIWQLPSLEGRSNTVRHILGDWELTTIVGAGTGQPFTAYAGALPDFTGGPSGTGFTDSQRPNRTSASCDPDGGPKEQIINPEAYTLNGFVLGTNGSARRGDCTGPGYFQTDLGLYKTFTLTNTLKFQFRWDIFNIFNNTNFLFAGFNSTMTPSSVTLSADGTRIENAAIPSDFGQATRTRDPRQMQFGFKLLW